MTGTCRRMLLFGSCVWVRPVCRRNMACFGCSAARLFGGTDGTGGAVARRIAVSGGAGCSPAILCGAGAEPAFRVRFPGPLSGSTFRTRLSGPLSGSASGLFRACFGICFRTCFGICFRICFRVRSGAVSGPAFRICFRGCRPDAGAILFDCGMRRVVPIRPQDSSV